MLGGVASVVYMSNTTTYTATLPTGDTITVKSSRTYTHAVVTYSERDGWAVEGFTGSAERAAKLASASRKWYPEVVVVVEVQS